MRTVIFYLAALAALAFTGCTSKSVETVQNKPSANRNFSIGEILVARSFCDSSKWSDSKNEAGDTIVQYSCIAKLDDAAMESAKKMRLDRIAQLVDQYRSDFAKAESSLANASPATSTSYVDRQLDELASQRKQMEELDAICIDGTGLSTVQIRENHDRGGRICNKAGVAQSIGDIDAKVLALQAEREQVRAEIAKEDAELASKRQVFTEKKAAYFSKLEELEAADRKALDNLFESRSKVEQQAFFKVYGDEVAVSDFKFFSDGAELAMNRSAMIPAGSGFLMFPSELASPKGPKSKADWDRWWAERIHPELKLKLAEFESACERSLSCMPVN